MKQFFLATALVVLEITAIAQSNTGASNPERKWGIEADLLVPFVPTAEIITIRGSRTITGNPQDIHGDLMFGIYLRPNVEHDVVEEIDEYLLTLGYRQYLWKGLHLEAQSDMGYAWGWNNKVDGQDYEGFAWLIEGHAGYKFLFSPKKAKSLYLLPQVGIIHGLVTDIGPRGGKSDTFFSAKINLGFAF